MTTDDLLAELRNALSEFYTDASRYDDRPSSASAWRIVNAFGIA